LVTLRVMLDGIVDKPRLESFRPRAKSAGKSVATTRTYFDETGWVDCPVYQRETLSSGQAFAGPAIIVETGSTTVVWPQDKVEVDGYGNIIIQVAPRQAAQEFDKETAGVAAS
jgi:N-methylhydantoinase A